MPYCGNCGTKVAETERFCANCGSLQGVGSEKLINENLTNNSRLSPKKYIIIGLIATVIVISFTIFRNSNLLTMFFSDADDTDKETVEVQEINIRGNTVGNLNNGGWVASQGDWIYFLNDINEPNIWNIYKIHADGTGLIQINNDNSSSINVVGDWIYYTAWSDGYKLYKVRTDGTKRTLLSNDSNLGNVHLVDGWIYYIHYEGHADVEFYKIRTDGTERTMLFSGGIGDFNIVEDWIYYRNYEGQLYKIRTDGTQRTLLSSGSIGDINVVEEWIYYIDMNDDRKIYKIRTDGTERTKVNTDHTHNMNVDGGWIYYSNGDDNHKMYKIRTDGTELTQLNNDIYSNAIGIAIDWIYYYIDPDYDFDGDRQLYRIRTDGTERQIVN